MKRFLSTVFISSFLLFLMSCMVGEGEHSHNHHSHDAPSHGHSANNGIVAPLLLGQMPQGYIELKLHDDKGDLELWITEDGDHHPIDLPLDSIISVSFPELDNKTLTLRVRDKYQNPDEHGNRNIRNKKTNYFIFPGKTGASAEFLKGKDFASAVVVSFLKAGKVYQTEAFTLKPHTH